ncbi:hypothetical protein Q5752_002878 [Cryptotrichosporon argae]
MSAQLSAQVTAHSTAVIAADARLSGDITFGAGCVVHPRAVVRGGTGIVFGHECVVEENAVVENLGPSTVSIGDSNVFMVDCRVNALSVGSHNTFSPRCVVAGVAVADHCSFGPLTTALVPPVPGAAAATVESYTVIYGSNSERRTWDGTGAEQERALRAKHTQFLRDIIPKANKLRPKAAV